MRKVFCVLYILINVYKQFNFCLAFLDRYSNIPFSAHYLAYDKDGDFLEFLTEGFN